MVDYGWLYGLPTKGGMTPMPITMTVIPAIALEISDQNPPLTKISYLNPRNKITVTMVSDTLYKTIRSSTTITSHLFENPNEPPGEIATQLYGEEGGPRPLPKLQENTGREDLERAYDCGRWGGERPSDLFLAIYRDALLALENDYLAGMVSPPLMGSCGVLPLTIISTLPDIASHIANCIARATTEVYLATNLWAHGSCTTLITNALRELSRRAGERGQRRKIAVKVIYDRGDVRQVSKKEKQVTYLWKFFDNHLIVPPSSYTTGAIKLPAPDEIPNIDMQVMNYHRPLLGIFHSKYVIIDRAIALLMSCNLWDTDNVEMMCHFEGPIVDSFYDMALMSWHKTLDPPLPMLDMPAAVGKWNGNVSGQPSLCQRTSSDSYATPLSSPSTTHISTSDKLPPHTTDDPHYDPDIESEAARVQASVSPFEQESRMQAVTKHLRGTNEMTVHKMYTSLDPEQRKNLHVHYYVAKDQTRPINAKFKERSFKLLIVDDHLSIQGNGNQDTQSWFHSQEINVMLDSAAVCAEWKDALRRNQNTEKYGEVSQEDGSWKDDEGKGVEGALGWDVGRFSWMWGIVGAFQKVRGVGGF
ncbi:hypothetical protein FGG08_006466 [Glutinoglossum americanum]|uniref:PLD phosphodiesterase domain-containing protein n=1 Tax=Glutinoglossum americanum TaxID=1670608 RepID=A0A9P8L0W3_9PEZI|nr:hypothetical protein FGG08_006466 [Glutinoglossum americanum]